MIAETILVMASAGLILSGAADCCFCREVP
jgi:hypothetical protein